jgi:prophage regulatory protein
MNLPENGFLKLGQIIGQREITREEADENRRAVKAAIEAGSKPPRRFTRPRPEVQGVLPMCKSKWWAGVACGRYPAPVHDGPTALWSVRAIRELLDRIGAVPSDETPADRSDRIARASLSNRHASAQGVSP